MVYYRYIRSIFLSLLSILISLINSCRKHAKLTRKNNSYIYARFCHCCWCSCICCSSFVLLFGASWVLLETTQPLIDINNGEGRYSDNMCYE